MKNSKRLLTIIIIVSVFILGCTKQDKSSSKEVTDVNANTNASESKIMNGFMKLIKPNSTASDIGKYIKDNIKDANESDAQKMIEYLMIYQTEVKDDFSEKMGKSEYLEALNKDMGGVLDASKIKNISDKDIRADYQSLIDGFMTIVRYEETPVIETDWKVLNEYSSVMPEDLKEMIEIYKKIQNNEYKAEESEDDLSLDRFSVAEDMIKVENILKTNKSDFIEWQANELYDVQLSTLLVGPEGEYLDLWTTKNSKAYANLINIKNKYKGTKVSDTISALDNIKAEDRVQVIDKINQVLQFGVISDNYLKNIEYNKDGNEYEVLQLNISDKKEKEKEKQDKINKIIKDDVEKYVDSLNIKEPFIISTFSNFGNEKYISYSGYLNYKDYSIDNKNLNLYRTLDYTKEKYITLEEYFGTNFDSIKDDLEKITGKSLEIMPEFQIFDDGITLYPVVKGQEEYIHLNYKDLIPYFTLNELRHGK